MKRFSLFLTSLLLLALWQLPAQAQLKPGDQAPDFSLVSTDGDTITLAQQQGKIVILHFWKSN